MKIFNKIDHGHALSIECLGFSYKRAGEIAKASVFGFAIYKKVCQKSWLLGVTYDYPSL